MPTATGPYFHLHIPKTGGTSLRHWLSRCGVKVRGPAASEVYLKNCAVNPLDWQVLSDHFDRGAGNGADRLGATLPRCFTVLRDPFSQVVSLWHYWNQRPDRVLHAHGRAWDLADVASDLPTFIESNPVEPWQFVPRARYPEAFAEYALVGVTELTEEWLPALARLLGVPVGTMPRLLVQAYEPPDPGLRAVYRRRRPDLFEAYEWVVAHWRSRWRAGDYTIPRRSSSNSTEVQPSP